MPLSDLVFRFLVCSFFSEYNTVNELPAMVQTETMVVFVLFIVIHFVLSSLNPVQLLLHLSIHQFIIYHSLYYMGSQGAGVYPSWHWERDGERPGQVARIYFRTQPAPKIKDAKCDNSNRQLLSLYFLLLLQLDVVQPAVNSVELAALQLPWVSNHNCRSPWESPGASGLLRGLLVNMATHKAGPDPAPGFWDRWYSAQMIYSSLDKDYKSMNKNRVRTEFCRTVRKIWLPTLDENWKFWKISLT